jgi:peroxiredoxin
VAKRSAFVIDKQGVVRYAESSDDPAQLPNFDKIKQTLMTLK